MITNFYVTAFCIFFSYSLLATTLPEGFIQEKIAEGLDPTALTELPDGRILLTEKSGDLLMVDQGVLLPQPVLSISVNNFGEWGLLGVAPDPNFLTNGYIYFYYTEAVGGNNVLARATMIGNLADPNSVTTIFTLDPKIQSASHHNGGAMKFGPDGKLYIAVGDGGAAFLSQDLNTTHGKILRINPDGSIPQDNPFYGTLNGNDRAIWAYGVRNPFSIDIQPGTGLLYACDVGEGSFEEIIDIRKGKNYGWPQVEGFANGGSVPDNYQDPVHAYGHNEGCSIVGAAFYNPDQVQFPAVYLNKFFFADYCDGYIKVFDPVSESLYETFATEIDRPIAILTASDGSLYYIERRGIGDGTNADNTMSTNGVLWKVTYAENQAPVIAEQPQSITVSEGDNASFSLSVSGATSPSYQWYKNNNELLVGETNTTLTINNVTGADDGSTYICVVNYGDDGTLTSDIATLTVIANQRPVVTITSPTDQTTYEAGDVLSFGGTVNDPETGPIDPQDWVWQIDFHHNEHVHPALGATSGIAGGTYTIPSVGHGATNVWYRVYLSAADAQGLSTTHYVEIFPKLINIDFTSVPEGIDLLLEGQTVTTPHQFESVVGIVWTGVAPQEVTKEGTTYRFSHWQEDLTNANFPFRADDDHATVTAHYNLVPTITSQPQSQTITVGSAVNFSIEASPQDEVDFQWYQDGQVITGASQPTLSIPAATLDRNGQTFYGVVTHNNESVTSNTVSLTVLNGSTVSIRAFLQGPFQNGQMTTNLQGIIPNAQPYQPAYQGSEYQNPISEDIVDWVLVQLLDDLGTVQHQRAAFIHKNGYVVDLNGTDPVFFPNVVGGDFYIVLQHRNHLSIMSKERISFDR